MMRWMALALCVAGSGGAAETFQNCTAAQEKQASAAIDGAKEMALRAAVAVGDTRAFRQWFGTFSEPHGEAVRANLKAIHKALAADELTTVCLSARQPDCRDGTFAYVMLDRLGEVNVCPAFFRMPGIADALEGRSPIANGTREGTIIHEVSHFDEVAGTGDDCYGRAECREFALDDPAGAVRTADSHQYFAEDALLAFWLASQ